MPKNLDSPVHDVWLIFFALLLGPVLGIIRALALQDGFEQRWARSEAIVFVGRWWAGEFLLPRDDGLVSHFQWPKSCIFLIREEHNHAC